MNFSAAIIGSLTAASILASSVAPALAEAPSSITIYSKNADPSNPINIRGGIKSNTVSAMQVSSDVPSSSDLGNVDALTPEELAQMEQVFKIIEDANAIKEVETDDPLSGMSPDQRAYFEAIQAVVPMTPEQVIMFRKRYEATRDAERKLLKKPASPTTRSISLDLRPSEEIPVIRTQNGRVSTVTFSDMNGNPWPIMSATIGDNNAFSAQKAGEAEETNIMVITPKTAFGSSNVVVTLADNPVPVLLSLQAMDEQVIDYRTDVRIEKKGPNSSYEMTTHNNLPSTSDSVMMAFLDGLPPDGAQRLETSSSRVEAWEYGNEMFVRTQGDVLSPDYQARSSNVSGTNVFIMRKTPVVLLSQGGVLNSINIKFH